MQRLSFCTTAAVRDALAVSPHNLSKFHSFSAQQIVTRAVFVSLEFSARSSAFQSRRSLFGPDDR
jgi:hypothetical protein